MRYSSPFYSLNLSTTLLNYCKALSFKTPREDFHLILFSRADASILDCVRSHTPPHFKELKKCKTYSLFLEEQKSRPFLENLRRVSK